MPTYQYRCLKCEHEFEFVQKMTDSPLTQCPSCKGKVKRLIGTGAGIIFKGSGFYSTDYRSDDYKKKAQQENKKGAASEKSDTPSKTDTAKSAKAEAS